MWLGKYRPYINPDKPHFLNLSFNCEDTAKHNSGSYSKYISDHLVIQLCISLSIFYWHTIPHIEKSYFYDPVYMLSCNFIHNWGVNTYFLVREDSIVKSSHLIYFHILVTKQGSVSFIDLSILFISNLCLVQLWALIALIVSIVMINMIKIIAYKII